MATTDEFIENNIKYNNKNSKHYNLLQYIQGSLKNSDKMKDMAKQHIESFNYSMTKILKILPKYIRPIEIKSNENSNMIFSKKLIVSIENLELGNPILEIPNLSYSINNTLYPSECRERQINYNAPLLATITRKFDNSQIEAIRVKLGNIPIMVKSDFCNLKNKSLKELINLKEDIHDFGGYFIINGLEKLIRMITITRRNYPIAYIRPSATKKKQNCSEFVCEMKCVREDLTSHTISLHYMYDGTICLRILLRKQELMIPFIIILKSLLDSPDIYLYNRIVRGNNKNSKLQECVEVLIADGKKYGFSTKKEFLSYLGKILRNFLGFRDITDITNEEVGIFFIKEYICIHVNDWNDKFNILCLMAEKLYLLAFGMIKEDNCDAPMNHEVLLSGHLYLMVLKEKIEDMLRNLEQKITQFFKTKRKDKIKAKDINWIKKVIDGLIPISKRMEYFLSTGNLLSRSGLDLKQQVGYTIAAERLNIMRYISHFQSVHRGQFFQTMKTTSPRKLLPESWGFLCPVHTPDGGPIGLLLHISEGCEIIASQNDNNNNKNNIEITLSNFGMIPISSDLHEHIGNDSYPVILDGCLIGYIHNNLVKNFVNSIRYCKIFEEKNIPKLLEIAFIPRTTETMSFQFPGVFLFNCLARMVRKVKNLPYNKEEYIGPIEQLYLDIACLPEDIKPGTNHQEIDNVRILSLVAGLTPFCEYNQSPRNLYQCQMGKQTMSIPYFNFPYRCDNKSYRILFPQSPIVRTRVYEQYGFDYYPSGTNAVVAVLAYTGYDMEDAMIINKSAYERGFGHGIVYKTKTKILNEKGNGNRMSSSEPKYRMLNCKIYPHDKDLVLNALRGMPFPSHIDYDGLPFIDTYLQQGMIEMIYIDNSKNSPIIKLYKDSEPAWIDQIRIFPSNNLNDPYEIYINFKYRIKRNPVIGDKFSSRHGQKGVLSQLWPQINMPFTEDGITPDCIINPHAFPSRMTIGMLIESLAGKSGALDGKFQEFPTFSQFENDDAIGYFGKELLKNGFNYYGNEIMYSGISGMQLKADIFIGVVYYQRLRHMVGDKAQARATGPIEVLSRQPVKGRKKGGGIRFGEMERDALLAHGISYCLNDRLFKSSDYSEGFICKKCGEMLAVVDMKKSIEQNDKIIKTEEVFCRNCQSNTCVKVAIPYVLRFLTNELAAMNIKLNFGLKEKEGLD